MKTVFPNCLRFGLVFFFFWLLVFLFVLRGFFHLFVSTEN